MIKSIFIIISTFALYFKCISQDEFIAKFNNQISDYTLKIKSISKDTLTYKAFGKIKEIALRDLYCYRYKKGYWICPDTTLKGKVINGEFVVEIEYHEYKNPEYILRPYYYNTSTTFIDFRQEYKIAFTKDSLKTKTLKKNRQVSFSLNTDTLNALFMCDLYKIIEDTLIISGYFGGGKIEKYWKIPIESISYIDFQTDGQKALKITSSILFSAFVYTGAAIGGNLFIGTMPGVKLKKKYDLNSNVNYKFIKIQDDE